MHENAMKWDKEHNVDNSFATGRESAKGKSIPENRPCDWCGKLVDKGYIHEKCAKEEQTKWLDILY
jgi:hypothetical protein